MARSECAAAASDLDEEDLVDYLGSRVVAVRLLTGREVGRAFPVEFYHLVMLVVEAADGPQRADAELSGRLAVSCDDAAVERRDVAEDSQLPAWSSAPGSQLAGRDLGGAARP